MKKILISVMAVLVAVSWNAAAQAPKAYKLTLAESANAPSYALPLTTVKVKVTIEKETILTGPYARYAQKYMGAIAPLSDKVIYSIKSAEISYADPDTKEADPKVKNPVLPGKEKPVSHVRNQTGFSKAQPDRTSLADRSLEDMAREAANTIFTLRKRRFELVTGEAGEHVYGAGLKAAIEEMARMENEYLSLFFGKQTITTIVREYQVMPEAGKFDYIPFRFSSEWGAMPESDVSGDPVVLSIRPDGKAANISQGKTDKRSAEFYRVADWTTCTLLDGMDELASARVPVYQFGSTVAVGGK